MINCFYKSKPKGELMTIDVLSEIGIYAQCVGDVLQEVQGK